MKKLNITLKALTKPLKKMTSFFGHFHCGKPVLYQGILCITFANKKLLKPRI